MDHPRTRTLSLLLMTALLAGCSGAGANTPPLSTQRMSPRTAQSSSAIESASIMKIRLVAPLQASFTRTGITLELTDARCEHKPIPKKLDTDGFPLGAVAFATPHTARIPFSITPFANPCDRNANAAHSMSIVFPSPVPSATPVFSTDGYYAIGLDADANGRVSMFDVSGPVPVADGVMHFTQNWLSLSVDDTYAFYLATFTENH